MPESARCFFLTDNGPHLVDFGRLDVGQPYARVRASQGVQRRVMDRAEGGLFFYHAQHGHRAHPQHARRVATIAAVERHLHHLPLGLGQAAVGDRRELKNRPLTRGRLTAIAVRTMRLLPRFYDLGAVAVWTGHWDGSHLSIPVHMKWSEKRHSHKY